METETILFITVSNRITGKFSPDLNVKHHLYSNISDERDPRD